MISPTSPGVAVPYYGLGRLRPVLTCVFAGSPQAFVSVSARRRLWAVLAVDSSSLSDARLLGIERPLARHFGHVSAGAHVFSSTVLLAVVEWAPAG